MMYPWGLGWNVNKNVCYFVDPGGRWIFLKNREQQRNGYWFPNSISHICIGGLRKLHFVFLTKENRLWMLFTPSPNLFNVTMSHIEMRTYLVKFKKPKFTSESRQKIRLKNITKLNHSNIQYQRNNFEDNVKNNFFGWN